MNLYYLTNANDFRTGRIFRPSAFNLPRGVYGTAAILYAINKQNIINSEIKGSSNKKFNKNTR